MTTVLGVAALARFIEAEPEPDDGSEPQSSAQGLSLRLELSERESLLIQRERELSEQERALLRMADGLTAREGELDRREERLDTARVDLDIREGELREAGGDELRRITPRAGNCRRSAARGEARLDRVVRSPAPFAGETTSADAPERRERTFVRARRAQPPSPFPLAQRSRSAHRPAHSRKVCPPRRIGAWRRAPLWPAPEPGPPRCRPHALVTEPNDPEPEVAPPEAFAALQPGQMALTLCEDELWLFVQLEEAHASSFRHGADLMLQYAEPEGYPVALLSLVDHVGSVYAIRYVLDGHNEPTSACRAPRARSAHGRLYVRSPVHRGGHVAVLREGGLRRSATDREAAAERPALAAAEALAGVLHAPPPLWNDDLPFGRPGARRRAP